MYIREQGPDVKEQINKWTTTLDGKAISKINLVRHPGYGAGKSGKALQAENARGLAAQCNVILIGYSAGMEAILMYARWRIDNNQPVRAVALLGSTFVSNNETESPDIDPGQIKVLCFGQTPLGSNGVLDRDDIHFDDWADYINYLLLNKVDVLVWHDDSGGGDAAPGNYTAPSGGKFGSFGYFPRTSYRHTGLGPDATSDSDIAKKEVYDWIFSH